MICDQVCSNGTRVFIQESIFDDFVSELVSRTQSIQHGDPHHEDTKIGAMIHADQGKRVMGFIERAVSQVLHHLIFHHFLSASKQGATVLCGGDYKKMPSPLSGGCYINPCILRK